VRAVLDPNVIVSSLLSSGTTAAVLNAWLDRRAFEPIVCPQLLSELEEALARPKFEFLSRALVVQLVEHLRSEADLTEDPTVEPGVTPDPDDDYLVALARQAGADCLVSGDPHLKEAALTDIEVLTPTEFPDRLPND
jgi:uncharacterized protein